MPATMILNTGDLKPGRILTVGIDGDTLTGMCVGVGDNSQNERVAFMRWETGATGRVTDGFLAECHRVSIDFNGRF